MNGIGLQLYTLRDALGQDLPGTLKRVAAIGYKYVEAYSFDAAPPAEWRKLLKDTGLTATSLMFPLAEFESKTDGIIDACKTLECKYAVLPWSPVNQNPSPAAYRKIGETLATAAAKLKPHGIKTCYHNHAEEIRTFEGRLGLDYILDASPDIYSELDVYWAHVAGADPVATMKRLGKRIGLLHLKDATPKKDFAPVGAGVLDWKAIRAAIPETGAGWAFVEQDKCEEDPFVCVTKSLNFLNKG